MLARTLLRGTQEGSATVASSSSSHAAATVAAVTRAAPYTRFSTLRLHGHKEPNFRARPAGWKGWNDPKLQDPWAPFAQQSPCRHVERQGAGCWFAMGHFALKDFFGVLHWRFWARIAIWGGSGMSIALWTYALRMHRNGWEWKNRGAVFAME
ncbi:uncharacterized protein TEOVI_000529600 [Trypanosoma equiperdum]|uniref:Uncharacterized protein n=2 Tax=Trypanozoon TaxID=39700 RepID=Q57XS9_TRYB2|nr:hypothetical protein, conserved [Trypanosoma brucei brucei TREU927]AAX69590.1 hypothetical protein, conserved [Trypanosoma brucei]AAZ12770.1 hypothetical protein, conserved [Trypanosoma brucei brucei TREU927]SCU64534.1 hypothetical protein, conserved [Trypanosoma equiperdum]